MRAEFPADRLLGVILESSDRIGETVQGDVFLLVMLNRDDMAELYEYGADIEDMEAEDDNDIIADMEDDDPDEAEPDMEPDYMNVGLVPPDPTEKLFSVGTA